MRASGGRRARRSGRRGSPAGRAAAVPPAPGPSPGAGEAVAVAHGPGRPAARPAGGRRQHRLVTMRFLDRAPVPARGRQQDVVVASFDGPPASRAVGKGSGRARTRLRGSSARAAIASHGRLLVSRFRTPGARRPATAGEPPRGLARPLEQRDEEHRPPTGRHEDDLAVAQARREAEGEKERRGRAPSLAGRRIRRSRFPTGRPVPGSRARGRARPTTTRRRGRPRRSDVRSGRPSARSCGAAAISGARSGRRSRRRGVGCRDRVVAGGGVERRAPRGP